MTNESDRFKTIFSQEKLDALFPSERSNQFFDALFGDADEGAYDIRLAFNKLQDDHLHFDFQLHQRPGKCLACNLTYGLPKVFERHPVIDVKGVVKQLSMLMNGKSRCTEWMLGKSREIYRELHVVPLIVKIESI
ncbi:MAG: pancreas/duodenum homeobox protein 1 [Desulfobacteraceae bacterium]|jgi:hypothetical protein